MNFDSNVFLNAIKEEDIKNIDDLKVKLVDSPLEAFDVVSLINMLNAIQISIKK